MPHRHDPRVTCTGTLRGKQMGTLMPRICITDTEGQWGDNNRRQKLTAS